MNTGFHVRCRVCNMEVQEVETLHSGGVTLRLLLCPECGQTATLVTNTLYETGTKILAST